MRACPLVKSVLYLLFVTASSVQSRCPGAQLSCLSRSSPSLVLCIEKDDLCSDGGVVLCQEGALGNITLQCSSNPPVFTCTDDGQVFSLKQLCDGRAQCSDRADESSGLCQDTLEEGTLSLQHLFQTSTRMDSQTSTITFATTTKLHKLQSVVASHTHSQIVTASCIGSSPLSLSTMAATPFMPVEDTQPEKGFASMYLILLASVSSTTILVVIVFVSLMMVFHKMSRNKGKINAKSVYTFNSNSKDNERNCEDDWKILNSVTRLMSQEDRDTNKEVSLSPQSLSGLGSKYEVPFSALDLQKQVEMGTFGAVYKAELRNLCYPHRHPKLCVVKLLKETATEVERAALLSQCALMQRLEQHSHVLKVLGCCTTGERIAVIHEYCDLGNLRDFLIRNRKKYQEVSNSRRQSNAAMVTPCSIYSRTPVCSSLDFEEISLVEQAAAHVSELSNGWDNNRKFYKEDEEDEGDLDLRTLLSFGRQVTLGMEYLVQKKIIHGRLAARKVLVCPDWSLKISDFGISQDIYEDLHQETEARKAYLKWMALEAVKDGVFTTMSDMWSFGVVLWEVLTLGSLPYKKFSNSEFLEILLSGYRLSKPKNCPQHLYELMLSCWSEDPSSRPTFKRARQHIDQVILTTAEAEEYLLLVESQLSIT